MGRYIGSPESLVSEIENIVPTASRFNNRCLYTTPGTYSFTVPSGISSITAVAVGPGGEQCSILKCLVTCGMMQCLGATLSTVKCINLEAGCCYSCPACSPTLGTCLCAFDVTRCLNVCMQKVQWCLFQCTSGDISSSNCVNCYNLSCLGMMNQTQVYTHAPSGAGGGYVEKTANTAPGCVYAVVVGANCCAGGFSCVSGANVSICATGPQLSSNAHITGSTTCDVYFHNGTCWVCMLPENIMTSCTLTTALCTTPCRCYANQLRCGQRSQICYCIVSTWDLKCSPGCGFGGDINRVGGWCVLDLCNSLTGTANTSYYRYDCCMCTMQQSCLVGCMFKCTAGACDIDTAFCCMRDVAVTATCCMTIGSIRSYNFIRTLALGMQCFIAHNQLCMAICKAISGCEMFNYCQQIREVGNTIACVTNFNVLAPGTHNPYSTPAGSSLHADNVWITCICMCSTNCENGSWYCSASGSACSNNVCGRTEFYYDFMCDCYCINPFRVMNCAMGGNVNNRFKFGGSSAGNYFRNGVSGLGDESVYTLTCNRQFGHCGSTPYVACCSFNCGFNNFSSTVCVCTCLCRSTYSINEADGAGWFNDMYCMTCASGYALACGSSFDCMLRSGVNYGLWPVQKSTGDEFGVAGLCFYCTNYMCAGSGELCNSLDAVDARLPNALTACLSGFTGFRWKHYNNPYKNIFFGNQMLNMYQAQGGLFCCGCAGVGSRIFYPFCENQIAGGTFCVTKTCVWPARTTNRYYTDCRTLDSCYNSGPAGLLRCIITDYGTYSSQIACNFACITECATGVCRSQGHWSTCHLVACHNYWPCCVGYNFITATCKVFNRNPTINLYDYWCSSPCLCAVNQVGLQTPFCHMQTFGYNLVFPEKWLTAMYYPGANTLSPCCIYKSTDAIDITDNHYNVTYTAGLYMCACMLIHQPMCSCSCQADQFRSKAIITRLNTGVCLDQTKTLATISCGLASSTSYAQGGAGIGTAGIWGEGVVTCTLVCSGGGNLRCIVPCCNISMCVIDTAPGCCATITICKALGWGLGPNQVSLSVVDLTGCGSGGLINPQFVGMGCCCGWGVTIGGCSGNLPFNSMCVGCSAISQVDLLGTGGTNYSACTVICSAIDRFVWTCCTYRQMATNMFCCWVGFCCACWIPEVGSYRCSAFVNTDGCARAMGQCCSVILQPLFCAIVQPAFSCYCCVASVYAEGSGGGSKTGQAYCAKYSAIIDSPTIVSINPARGGRGNESPYEPYYYSYPGISARLSTPKSPTQYVGDPSTGCSWFDTPQINGSGGNGMFCSADFSCIYVQEAGPGGGGSNGAKADGTICGLGGVLGGGAGCCGTGGYGGGAGWMGTPGTGMVVIYWNA